MTQIERIRQYLEDFGSITPYEAFLELGITKLSTRIGEMRRLGDEIRQEKVAAKNRYGEDTSFMRYSLGR